MDKLDVWESTNWEGFSTRWMDEGRYVGEVSDWCRGEDAGDLKRSALNELVENLTGLNALERKIWKIDPKILTEDNLSEDRDG